MVNRLLKLLHLGKINRAGHHESSWVKGWDAAERVSYLQSREEIRISSLPESE